MSQIEKELKNIEADILRHEGRISALQGYSAILSTNIINLEKTSPDMDDDIMTDAEDLLNSINIEIDLVGDKIKKCKRKMDEIYSIHSSFNLIVEDNTARKLGLLTLPMPYLLNELKAMSDKKKAFELYNQYRLDAISTYIYQLCDDDISSLSITDREKKLVNLLNDARR